MELIQQAAESQYQIEQVRRCKAQVLANVIEGAESLAEFSSARLVAPGLEWQRLDRYERSAFKRRQAALFQLTRIMQARLLN